MGPVPSGVYVQSVRVDSQDVTGRRFEVTANAEMEIALSRRAAVVSGVVASREGVPLSGVVVGLWKADRPPGATENVRVMQTSANGRYEFSGLAPGEYRVAAWEELEPGLFAYEPFLAQFEGKAARLQLSEGAQVSMDLTVVSEAEVRGAEARLP